MATDTIRLDTKQITLRIEMPRLFGFRMWLTVQLLKLVGFICPLTLMTAVTDELQMPERRTYTTQKGERVPNQWELDDGNFELMSRLDLYLDGVKQDAVVAYDADAGLVRRHVLDSDGKPQLNAARDEVLKETVRGKVEVVLAR